MTQHPSVLRLAIAQALSGANTTVVYATAAIIGHLLAPRPGMATLPISVFVIGMALSTLPVGAVARKHGRRAAFFLGNGCGVVSGLLASLALMQASFVLFCIAMLFGGAYAAVVLTFRFAAAECVPAGEKPRALSVVLAGGVPRWGLLVAGDGVPLARGDVTNEAGTGAIRITGGTTAGGETSPTLYPGGLVGLAETFLT